MSLETQEKVLLDLLFDHALRARFVDDPEQALASYGLDASELADFVAIDRYGLEVDARMRRDLLLHRLARSFPLSFSIASSLRGGLDVLRSLVDVAHMRLPAEVRTAGFGERMRDALVELPFANDRERALCMAIVDAEVAFAATQATLRESAIGQAATVDTSHELPSDWASRPLAFAPALCALVLPRSYGELKKLLCPCAPEELWARLQAAPLPARRLSEVLAAERPRLVIARAVAPRTSRCEATVTLEWLELAQGFAPLLRHVDGKTSAERLIAQLARAGAKPELVEGVRAGLRSLVERGMLRFVAG